jgi:hypothetical protein
MPSLNKQGRNDLPFFRNYERMLSTGLTLKKQLFSAVNTRAGGGDKFLERLLLIIVAYRVLAQENQEDIASRIIRSIAWMKLRPDCSRAA